MWGFLVLFFGSLVAFVFVVSFVYLFLNSLLLPQDSFLGFFNSKSYSLIDSSVREKSVAAEHKVCAAGLLVSIINFVMLQLRDFVPDAGVQPDGLSRSGFKVLLVF